MRCGDGRAEEGARAAGVEEERVLRFCGALDGKITREEGAYVGGRRPSGAIVRQR